MDTKVVIDEVKEMIRDKESELYIRIYLNDLARSGDISWKTNEEIYRKYVMSYLIKTGGYFTY